MFGRLPEGAVGWVFLVKYINGTALLASKKLFKDSWETHQPSLEYFENPYVDDTLTICVYPSNVDNIVIVGCERKNIGDKDIVLCVDLNVSNDHSVNDMESPVFFLSVVNSGSNLLPPNWYRTEYYNDYYAAISNLNGVLDEFARR